MRDDDQEINLRDPQDISLQIISLARDEVERILIGSKLDLSDHTISTLIRLMSYASGRSQCVSFLLSHQYLWDTEIVLRSFYEAIVKILFICQHPNEAAEKLVNEFWGDYLRAENKLTANRARIALKLAGEAMSSDDARIFAALSRSGTLDESISNKEQRRKVMRKWSFTEMVNTLDQSLHFSGALVHIYGIQSHLCHADNVALDFIYDDMTRPAEEARLKQASHVCRVLSDQANLWYIAALSISKLAKLPINNDVFHELLTKLSTETTTVTEAFHRSQDGLYDQLQQ
ncbi:MULTISPECIES: DUF5677 domain-containing protein [unclassified Yoonia]|uniref:DUF5677 domain-containing protein n=1 Tax=unclassified Yoonia TaxID=2629118 RepID=UPI002AFE82D6|nr:MULTISPECIES: DUF5677 domain-containing protein [unclassified Yoonia]